MQIVITVKDATEMYKDSLYLCWNDYFLLQINIFETICVLTSSQVNEDGS